MWEMKNACSEHSEQKSRKGKKATPETGEGETPNNQPPKKSIEFVRSGVPEHHVCIWRRMTKAYY